MQSSLKFSLAPEGERSLQPVISAVCYYTDDARDEIASNFSHRKGYKHNFLVWQPLQSDPNSREANLQSEFMIKNYKPDSDLIVLDASNVDGSNSQEFYSELSELCKRYNIEECWSPNGRYLDSPKEPKLKKQQID